MRLVRSCVLASIGCTLLGILFGLVFGTPSPIDVDLSVGFSFWKIFVHNVGLALVMIFGGVIFAAPTGMVLLLSGIPLGVGISVGVDPLLILPHALIEFPAIWIAGTAGFLIPASIVEAFRDPSAEGVVRSRLPTILALAVTSIALLAVAAAVEVFVTPWIAGL